MKRSWLAWVSLAAAGLMMAMAAAFWCWALAAGWLDLGSRWPGGAPVTATLWKVFLVGVPSAGALALVAGLLGPFRRPRFRPMAVVIVVLVAATGLFWLWSLMSAGM